MAFVDQALQILEGAKGGTVAGAKAVQAVKDYLGVADADNSLTNEQLAEAFVTDVRTKLKGRIRAGAMRKQEELDRANVIAQGDTAEADL